MQSKFGRRHVLTTIGGIIIGSMCGCGGCSPVAGIREFIVEVTEGTGKVIKSKATTLAAVLEDVWHKLFPEVDPTGVQINSTDKLSGVYPHQIRIRIFFPETDETGSATLEVTLMPPVRMHRGTINDRFDIAPENYPDEFRARLKEHGAGGAIGD
jgi:hypothetical protein